MLRCLLFSFASMHVILFIFLLHNPLRVRLRHPKKKQKIIFFPSVFFRVPSHFELRSFKSCFVYSGNTRTHYNRFPCCNLQNSSIFDSLSDSFYLTEIFVIQQPDLRCNNKIKSRGKFYLIGLDPRLSSLSCNKNVI